MRTRATCLNAWPHTPLVARHDGALEPFALQTYIAPIHYNCLKRKTALKFMSDKLNSSFKRMGSIGRVVSSPRA